MKKFFLEGACALFIAPVMLLAVNTLPEPVNLSGEWKLNEAKSELGNFSRFAARSIKIEQKADAITISKTIPGFNGGDNISTTETLSFDGKVSETTAFGNAPKKSIAKLSEDGQTVTITYTIIFERDGQTTEFKGTETWTLTKEGALSLQTVSSSPRGENTSKAIYDKG